MNASVVNPWAVRISEGDTLTETKQNIVLPTSKLTNRISKNIKMNEYAQHLIHIQLHESLDRPDWEPYKYEHHSKLNPGDKINLFKFKFITFD